MRDTLRLWEQNHHSLDCESQNGRKYQKPYIDGRFYCSLAVDDEGRGVRMDCPYLSWEEVIVDLHEGKPKEKYICELGGDRIVGLAPDTKSVDTRC
ncbi:MAG: hypothetical protein CMH63_01710 [Nanoarchaeota archaeon]|jgi:hypothetical protein|nr:hypothetical protein [Nanoarchaeota archaeon]|tara:strand:- start:21209 stop:21496 length:288 start_codon:yes stop_codon:yes gene_type:complete